MDGGGNLDDGVVSYKKLQGNSHLDSSVTARHVYILYCYVSITLFKDVKRN